MAAAAARPAGRGTINDASTPTTSAAAQSAKAIVNHVSRDQALAHVWDGAGATANVVDRYVAYLRRKLGDPPLIHTVRGVGFRLDG